MDHRRLGEAHAQVDIDLQSDDQTDEQSVDQCSTTDHPSRQELMYVCESEMSELKKCVCRAQNGKCTRDMSMSRLNNIVNTVSTEK